MQKTVVRFAKSFRHRQIGSPVSDVIVSGAHQPHSDGQRHVGPSGPGHRQAVVPGRTQTYRQGGGCVQSGRWVSARVKAYIQT